jgi:hypothetical protein
MSVSGLIFWLSRGNIGGGGYEAQQVFVSIDKDKEVIAVQDSKSAPS